MMAFHQMLGAVALNGPGAWGQAPLPPFVSLVYFVATQIIPS
jgi:hypothetical protein